MRSIFSMAGSFGPRLDFQSLASLGLNFSLKFRREYHQSFAQPGFRAEKKRTISGHFLLIFLCLGRKRAGKKKPALNPGTHVSLVIVLPQKWLHSVIHLHLSIFELEVRAGLPARYPKDPAVLKSKNRKCPDLPFPVFSGFPWFLGTKKTRNFSENVGFTAFCPPQTRNFLEFPPNKQGILVR